MSRGLCWTCRKLTEIGDVDTLGRGACAECLAQAAPTQEQLLVERLVNTIPYGIGDKVSCKTAGEHYDGVGEVVEVSIDPKDLASPVVPMFRVALTDKAYPETPDEIWYSEVCLERLSNASN
jgi:hypothetical protein